MLSKEVNSIVTTTNPSDWEWYHVYQYIMTVNNNYFVKYNKSLHHHLHSENINGCKLLTLSKNDWLKLGIDDANDVEILLKSIKKLETNKNTNSDTKDNSNTDTNLNTKTNDKSKKSTQSPTQTPIILNNMYMINGNLINNIHSTLCQNQLEKTQLTANCHILYLYAQQMNSQLQNEHNKRVTTENALNLVTCQSAEQQKILNDALISSYSQQSFLAVNYAKLQKDYKQCECDLGKKCEDKLNEYNKLKEEHRQLQEKYNEVNFKLGTKCTELQHGYNEMNEKYQELQSKIYKMDKFCNFKSWDFNDVYLWIINVDNGYFEKYESLYESLEILNINGQSLCEFDVDDINRIGICDVMDQRRFLANVRILIKNYSDSAISDDNSLYDFANIDLFSN